MPTPEPTLAHVRGALAPFGETPDAAALQWRDGRLAVHLPGDRMAWFPPDEERRADLARERRVLRLLEAYCGFEAPRVVHEDDDGWDLRALVPGTCDPFGVHGRLLTDPGLALSLGRDVGAILAEQHTRAPRGGLAAWLPAAPAWPDPADLPNLPAVVEDVALLARIETALARYARACADPGDRVLIHGDLGLHNMAFGPAGDRVAGVFDYEGAAFGDRHHDFKYLVFQTGDEAMLEGALSVYEPATGVVIDRERVRLFNAAAAIGYLAFRFGHAPEEDWCGRTLAQDLAWADAALAAAGL